jgi:hypothetical protein
MENIKAKLHALQAAQRSTEQGWTWFFDEANGIICAQKANAVRKVFIPHADSIDQQGRPTQLTTSDACLVAQTLNDMPKLLAALERAVAFAEGLDEMAEMRDRAARNARLNERYDLSEAHRQSAKRVRTAKEAFLEKMGEAFAQPDL